MSGLQERRAALVSGQGTAPDEAGKPVDVRAADEQIRRRQGHQVMAAVMAFGAAAESGRLERAVKLAQLTCITFVCVVPVYLFWAVALNG